MLDRKEWEEKDPKKEENRKQNTHTHGREEYSPVNGCQVIFQWRKLKLYRAECVLLCVCSHMCL